MHCKGDNVKLFYFTIGFDRNFFLITIACSRVDLTDIFSTYTQVQNRHILFHAYGNFNKIGWVIKKLHNLY